MAEFQRPQGFFFDFLGVNTRDTPDALQPGKYSSAQNIRATGKRSVRTRPGYIPLFSTGNVAITDIRSYAALNTNSAPRFLARDANGNIWLDNGVKAGNLNGAPGYGAAMVPFRPAESAQSWMYVATAGDYQRFSAPSSNNGVTQAKVGIAEPQEQVEAAPQAPEIITINGNWAPGGTTGVLGSQNRTTDTVVAALPDPAMTTRFSVQVSPTLQYLAGMLVNFGSNATYVPVEDVIPPIGGSLTIQSIYYANNNSGSCTIVLPQLPIGQISPGPEVPIANLRRGSLITIGTELAYVWSTIEGPSGVVAIKTSTNNTWTPGAAIAGVPAIVVHSNSTPSGGINASEVFGTVGTSVVGNNNSGVRSGIGYFYFSPSNNPFIVPLSPGNNNFAQEDDYFHISLQVSDPTALVQMLILLNIDNNPFTDNMLYTAVRQSDFADILNGNQTVISALLQQADNDIIGEISPPGTTVPLVSATGAAQWLEVTVPLSSLSRLGEDQSKTLATFNGVAVQVIASNNVTVAISSLWVGGGGQPDIGNNGAPYQYQAVPMNSNTGVRGNPTPVMRYGVSARRQNVQVLTGRLNTSYDAQIDTWEIYRQGGTIDTYRFIGTASIGSNFTDSVFDDAQAAGDPIVIDNTEPWPTIDIPWSVSSNNNATIAAFGTILQVTLAYGFPSTITRWLPGTIFQVGGQDAFTLRSRPTVNGNTVTFELEEVISGPTPPSVFVLEPNVARQPLPYVWGPDAQGFFFGSGDAFRPGVVSWAKGYAPDAVPTGYNLELCAPSEPQLGGAIAGGVSLAFSSKRWWSLNFQSGNAEQLFVQTEIPVGKRVSSPYGHCSDGATVYFWAEDGIALTTGGPADSLTDTDLYNLFPHGPEKGVNVVRFGVTFYAPNYQLVALFRLSIKAGLLTANYIDNTGIPRTLLCDVATRAWSQDSYADPMSVIVSTDQPSAALTGNNATYASVILGDTNGKVWQGADQTNDRGNSNGVPISGVVATQEWDAGDQRANKLFGDMWLDAFAPSGLTAVPVVQSAAVGNNTTFPPAGRQQLTVSTGGGILEVFMGMGISWADDFSQNLAGPTHLHGWQPSFAPQVETTTDRAADWTDEGVPTNKWFQGFILDADTFDVAKNLTIQDADTGNNHAIQPSPVQHNGRQTIPYSFVTPFLAHTVRDVPLDRVPWMKYSIKYVFQPTPESVQTWWTQWTALGSKGYKHVPRVEASYSSAQPVVLTILSYDGTSPQLITLPATAGATQRTLLTLTPNKGQLYRFAAQSPAPFQMFLEDFIVHVCDWGRQGASREYKLLGGHFGDNAQI